MDEEPIRHADAFTAMAERIDSSRREEFAGAFVFVPPTGDPVSMLLLDPAPNMGTFIGMMKGRLEVWVAEVEEAERQGADGQWGRRR